MPINLRFAFVCRKKWSELTGDDPVKRHCGECDREIINLDPLTEAEREQVFRNSIRTGTKLCVFATLAENGTPCEAPSLADDGIEFGWETGGEPEMDEYLTGADTDGEEGVEINFGEDDAVN